MKAVAVVAILAVAVLCHSVAVAQCSTVAECSGQQAEAAAQLREFRRATAAVVATDQAAARIATTEARNLSAAATALAIPTRTPYPTSTPQPTATSLPTLTPVPSVTPQPTIAQPNVVATVLDRVMATSTPRPKEDKPADKTSIYVVSGLAVLLIVGIVSFLLFKPETYTFYK